MALRAPIVDSIGIELETGIDLNDMQQFVRNDERLYNWQVHHDGSIDKIGYKIYGLPYFIAGAKLIRRSSNLIQSGHIFGSEVVSPILDTSQNDEWKDAIKSICEFLKHSLDKATPKVSTHFHVNSDKLPVGVLQNVIRTWMAFEDVFFRLSIGDELDYHRGIVRKDFLYCRPLSSPLVVLSDNKLFRPCFDVNKLLLANNLRQFFYSYGRCQVDGEPPRYYPARYSCVNFYSYLRPNGGSIEFRTPNLSTNPDVIFAWAELFKSIVRTSMGKGIEYPFMPLGTNPDNFDISIFQSLFELTDETMTTLSLIFNQTNWIKFNPRYVYSHTQQTEIYWEGENKKLIPDPIPSGNKIRRYSASSDNEDYDEFDSYKNITRRESEEERTPRRTRNQEPTISFRVENGVPEFSQEEIDRNNVEFTRILQRARENTRTINTSGDNSV